MMLSNRCSTFGVTCAQCHEELIAPDKSEYCAGTHIRHLWHCSSCSARFESIEQIPVGAMTSDDIFLSAVAAKSGSAVDRYGKTLSARNRAAQILRHLTNKTRRPRSPPSYHAR
jgi:hypothetical protein